VQKTQLQLQTTASTCAAITGQSSCDANTACKWQTSDIDTDACIPKGPVCRKADGTWGGGDTDEAACRNKAGCAWQAKTASSTKNPGFVSTPTCWRHVLISCILIRIKYFTNLLFYDLFIVNIVVFVYTSIFQVWRPRIHRWEKTGVRKSVARSAAVPRVAVALAVAMSAIQQELNAAIIACTSPVTQNIAHPPTATRNANLICNHNMHTIQRPRTKIYYS